MGREHVDESLASLRRALPQSDWRVLAAACAMLPDWMAQAIGREAERG